MTGPADGVPAAPSPPAGGPALRWQLGRLSLGLLAVTALSGVVLVPFWSPVAPRASTEAIAGGLPWTWWFRGVHAYAAQAFLLATLAHLAEAVAAGAERRLAPGAWWRATMLLPVAGAALLGGFVMRGDAGAVAALQVWRGVLESVPGIGGAVATLLLGPPGGGPGVAALHHAGTFTLLAWLLSLEHGRRAWPDLPALALAALGTAAVAGLFPPGLDGPAPGDGLVRGPWYLWGLQGLLLDLPAWTGWVLAGAGLGLLGGLVHLRGRGRRLAVAVLLALLAAGAAWALRLVLAGPPP